MSSGAQVAILDSRGVRRTRPRSETHPDEQPAIRILAFAALALYGALRWGTMLSPVPVARMLALVALASAIVAFGPLLRERKAAVIALAGLAAFVALFALAGIPLSWIRHVRIAVTAQAIGEGIADLYQAFMPYNGVNQSIRLVIVLGGGLLLVLAALPLVIGPRPLGEWRRAASAFPLVVLAAVPATMMRPSVAYLHGLILLVLLAAFVWGERIPRRDAPLATVLVVIAGVVGMIAAPALDQHKPWLRYEALAESLAPGHVEAFDWSQRYGPLNWPRTGREILDVSAPRADYWKTENLELFNGTGWAAGSTDYGAQPPAPAQSELGRWSQTIQVTLRGVRTRQIVAAGYAAQPVDVSQTVSPGAAAGTWATATDLQPGDSYRVSTYSPHPTFAELAATHEAYSAVALQGELTMQLEQPGLPAAQIVFPPFGSREAPVDVANVVGGSADSALAASAYARVYALARRLAHQAHTPAGYVQRVLAYLNHGYTYFESPSPSRYPLVSFLLHDKAGYCQQFAGAMALLLRMGGVPARVATGFTTGTYDTSRHRFVVSDLDAHAWVEAWFPRYGWVRFDPTPTAAPARTGAAALPALHSSIGTVKPNAPVRRPSPFTPGGSSGPTLVHHGGAPLGLIGALVGGAVLLLGLGAALTVRRRDPDGEQLLVELERALKRCGRPVRGGLTLAALERRFRTAPEAAAYVSAIRLMRFGAGAPLPTSAQRRALRAQLRAGLGASGRLRALWALPPQWSPRSLRRP